MKGLKLRNGGGFALLQNCYNFFTLGSDLLTGQIVGDIINLNSEGGSILFLSKVARPVGL